MRQFLVLVSVMAMSFTTMASATGSVFKLPEKGIPNRIWVGPTTWANRLQDWRVQNGHIECIPNHNLPMRTLHLLSHDLSGSGDSFTLSVELGRIKSDISKGIKGEAGFLIGAGNGKMDYRGAALIHQTPGPGAGIFVGVDYQGRVFIHDNEIGLYFDSESIAQSKEKTGFKFQNVTLLLSAKKKSEKSWELNVEAKNKKDGTLIGKVSAVVPSERIAGNIALAVDPGQLQDRRAQKRKPGAKKTNDHRLTHFWFAHWKGEGEKLA